MSKRMEDHTETEFAKQSLEQALRKRPTPKKNGRHRRVRRVSSKENIAPFVEKAFTSVVYTPIEIPRTVLEATPPPITPPSALTPFQRRKLPDWKNTYAGEWYTVRRKLHF